jgi:hypothetical protein
VIDADINGVISVDYIMLVGDTNGFIPDFAITASLKLSWDIIAHDSLNIVLFDLGSLRSVSSVFNLLSSTYIELNL